MLKINRDVFQINEKGDNYLYAPLAHESYGRFLQIGKDVVELLDNISNEKRIGKENKNIVEKLKRRNILGTSESKQQSLEKSLEFCPTSTTLLLTTLCNLRCVYCYSNAGEVPIKDMNFETAKKAVDFISSNASKIKKDYFDICFHGGGEPFVRWPLMKEIVCYAQDRAKKKSTGIKTTIATNGVLKKDQLEWILKNNISLSLSLDGPEDIQNIQRPTKNGGPTFNHVLETINYLEENNIDYGIRATITNNSVSRLSELASFFYSVAPSAVGYSLEPLNQCGRCVKTKTLALDMNKFAEEFIKARKSINPKDRNKIHYSGARPNSIVLNFCGASGKNFFITPEGHVTSCLEVSDLSDPKSNVFFYGKESKTGFEFNESRLKTLSSICVENIPNCGDCFAKYSCAGDCPSRSSNNGNVFDTSTNSRCTANKKILFNYLKGGLHKDG